MSMANDNNRRDPIKFSSPLTCPACSQIGTAIWEESGPDDRTRGPERRLILVSSGFYSGATLGGSGDPRIVCEHCEFVLPD
jgi:hypothetical protein